MSRSLLGNDAVRKLNAFAEQRGVTVVAYTTDDEIVCTKTDEHTDILLAFSEPTPRGVGRGFMDQLGAQGCVGVHKMMLMGEEEKLAALRCARIESWEFRVESLGTRQRSSQVGSRCSTRVIQTYFMIELCT